MSVGLFFLVEGAGCLAVAFLGSSFFLVACSVTLGLSFGLSLVCSFALGLVSACFFGFSLGVSFGFSFG